MSRSGVTSGLPRSDSTRHNVAATATDRAEYLFYCTSDPRRSCLRTRKWRFCLAEEFRESQAAESKTHSLCGGATPGSEAKVKDIDDYLGAQSCHECGARCRATNRNRTVNLPSHY